MTTTDFLTLFETKLVDVQKAYRTGDILSDGFDWATSSGGKRIRPLGVYLGYSAIQSNTQHIDENDLEQLLTLAAGVELIHSYSLVHDDLPAMDNDDMRRGKPSTHKKFGEANGILIGDGLLSLAGIILQNGSVEFGQNFALASNEILRASLDMVEGQVRDLAGIGGADDFLGMYALKTGALFVCSFVAGAIIAGADTAKIEMIRDYAKHLGLAFQLADDLLDIGEQNSYLAVVGESSARAKLSDETKMAKDTADCLGSKMLAEFANQLWVRQK